MANPSSDASKILYQDMNTKNKDTCSDCINYKPVYPNTDMMSIKLIQRKNAAKILLEALVTYLLFFMAWTYITNRGNLNRGNYQQLCNKTKPNRLFSAWKPRNCQKVSCTQPSSWWVPTLTNIVMLINTSSCAEIEQQMLKFKHSNAYQHIQLCRNWTVDA